VTTVAPTFATCRVRASGFVIERCVDLGHMASNDFTSPSGARGDDRIGALEVLVSRMATTSEPAGRIWVAIRLQSAARWSLQLTAETTCRRLCRPFQVQIAGRDATDVRRVNFSSSIFEHHSASSTRR